MAGKDREKVFELVKLKEESKGQHEKFYQDISSETLDQPQKYEDSRFEKDKDGQTNKSLETSKDNNNKIYFFQRAMRMLLVGAAALILASLLVVLYLAISNYLMSTQFKKNSAVKFQVMKERIGDLNESFSLLMDDIHGLKSSMLREQLLRLSLTTQINEMMTSLRYLNDSLSAESKELCSLSLKTQNLTSFTSERNYVKAEIINVNGNISRLRSELSSVQATADRADRRIEHIAGSQVLTCSTERHPNSITLHSDQQTDLSVLYTQPSVSYSISFRDDLWILCYLFVYL